MRLWRQGAKHGRGSGGSASRHSGVQDGVTLLVNSKRVEKWSRILRLKARETEAMPLVTRAPMALEIGRRDLTNRVWCGEVWIRRTGREAGICFST